MATEVLYTVCETGKCTGCMACAEVCSQKAITIVDTLKEYNGVIKRDKCIDCGKCRKVCPNLSLREKLRPHFTYQGWCTDESIRMRGASGGVASAIMESFIDNGGVCCSCKFERGELIFDFADSKEKIQSFSGSKYIKSNPAGIYKEIQNRIKKGQNVLFIGLPCQSAALQNIVGQSDYLYTVDLICHGSPSPELFKMFMAENKVDYSAAKNISFREDSSYRIKVDNTPLTPVSVVDQYSYAFLKSVDLTECCCECKYADITRVSDITLGDAWGSNLNANERKKGVSLILCQTDKGKELLDKSALCLMEANLAQERKSNRQLNGPSGKTENRELFFSLIKQNKGFTWSINRLYRNIFIKQKIKALLKTLK